MVQVGPDSALSGQLSLSGSIVRPFRYQPSYVITIYEFASNCCIVAVLSKTGKVRMDTGGADAELLESLERCDLVKLKFAIIRGLKGAFCMTLRVWRVHSLHVREYTWR